MTQFPLRKRRTFNHKPAHLWKITWQACNENGLHDLWSEMYISKKRPSQHALSRMDDHFQCTNYDIEDKGLAVLVVSSETDSRKECV